MSKRNTSHTSEKLISTTCIHNIIHLQSKAWDWIMDWGSANLLWRWKSIKAKLLISGVTWKPYRGGVCLYINQKWCKNFIIREQVCLPDIELLSMSMRPYLPREFPQTNVTVVSILKRTQRLRLTPSAMLCTHSNLSLLRSLILFWGTLITVIWRKHWAVSINMWTVLHTSIKVWIYVMVP